MPPGAPAESTPPIETDALVIGAGPVGLFQVFELGLLEIDAQIVDSLCEPGGQCAQLYPDKPIYDIPGVPRCTGRQLIDNLLVQIEPFHAGFHLGQEVGIVQRQADDRFFVQTSLGTRFVAKTIVIAGGIGSFQPRRLKLDGLDAHVGTQVFDRLGDANRLAGQRVAVVGGGDAAIEAAIALASQTTDAPASVTLIHRRDSFDAPAASVEAMRDLCHAQAMRLLLGQVTGFSKADGRLSAVQVSGIDGAEHALPLDALIVCLGLSPRLGPIADWGLALERKQLVVDTETFSTNVRGIFAVGDVNTYAGKKKLIVSGFHEAALAAFGAAALVFPDRRIALQYTTTSPALHRRLGIAPPSAD